MEAARRAGFLSVKAHSKASPALDRLSAAAIRSGLRNEPGFAQIAERLLQAAFSEPVQRGGREPFFAAVRTPETAFISLLV